MGGLHAAACVGGVVLLLAAIGTYVGARRRTH